MHRPRRAIHLDAMRFAKSTQVKLDEINYRIEQDKKRVSMLNRFEKIKVWNELREIRRVFVPRYIPGETKTLDHQEQNDVIKKDSSKTQGSTKLQNSTQSHLASLPRNNHVPKLYSGENDSCDLNSNHVRKLKNSTRERKISPASTRSRTRELVSSGAGEKAFVLNQNEQPQKSVSTRRSWDFGNPRKISEDDNCSRKHGSEISSSSSTSVNEDTCPTKLVVPLSAEVHSSASESLTARSHSSLSQCGVKPSNPMLSVAFGYMAFKKLLRDKRKNDSLVSPRFRKQSESDETIASNSAFLRSKSAVLKPKTAIATNQRPARNGVENTTEEETVSSDNNYESKKPSQEPSRRLSESSSLSSGQTNSKPRARKLSAGWKQNNDRIPVESGGKRFGGSKVRIGERELATSTSKLQLHGEEQWEEECIRITKTVAWTANDAHTMKSLTS